MPTPDNFTEPMDDVILNAYANMCVYGSGRTHTETEDYRQLRELSNEELVLKQKEGKPSGARYCFLSALDLSTDVGKYIETLTTYIDTYKPIYIVLDALEEIQQEILNTNSATKNLIITDFINLRSQALKNGKYRENSYKQKIDVNLLIDALSRHYIKHSFGDMKDEESGFLHLSHMLANVIIIKYQIRTYYKENNL